MKKTKEKVEGGGYGKTIALTALKSVCVFVVLAFYVVAIMIGLAPKQASIFFDKLGMSGPASSCYEQIYQRSQKNIDLYNLIERQLRSGSYKKAAANIALLQSKQDYQAFAARLNKAAIEASEKKYLVYVADVDSYLVSQRVIALYRSGKKEEAKALALDDLYDGTNPYSFALASYVDRLLMDEKIEENGTLASVVSELYGEIPEGRVMDVASRILVKLSLSDQSLATSETDRIMRVYTCLKINYALLNIYEAKEDALLAASCRERIESLRSTYESLIV